MQPRAILLCLVLVASAYCAYKPNTEQSVTASHHHYDSDRDGVLDDVEFKSYFQRDYMDAFKNIDIDPKFIDSTINYIKAHDADHNGLSVQELIKAVIPEDDTFAYKEPGHYAEQDL